MPAQYILLKKIQHPMGSIRKGSVSIPYPHTEGYVYFHYIGMEKEPVILGNGFLLTEDADNMPEFKTWFKKIVQ